MKSTNSIVGQGLAPAVKNRTGNVAKVIKGDDSRGLAPSVKKALSLFLSLVMLLSITAGIDFSAYAAGNSISTATPISLNTTNKGSITDSNVTDVYKFVLETSGRITISATAYIYRVNYRLYDSNGEEIYNPNTRYNSVYNYYDCTEWNDKTGQSYISKTIDLTSGVYYFIVNEYSGNGNYKFNISFEDSQESFDEPIYCNNNLSQAFPISIGKKYRGQIALNDDKDFYKFSISKEQSLIFKASAYIYRIAYYIYDSNGKEVCNPNTHYNSIYNYYDCTEWNSDTKESYISQNVTLKPGTYYIGVIKYNGTGNYNFSLSCSHCWIGMTNKVSTFSNDGTVKYTCCYCGATKTSTIAKIAPISLSSVSYTYDGKVKTPSVTVKDSKGKKISPNNYTVTYSSGRKNVGKYTVTVKFKGNYSGTVKKTFTIKPKTASISKLTAGKKKFTIKWKKQAAQTTGYQIQYSTSSKFKNAKTITVSKNKTTSKTISKLKAKKKYYVRIRTYKTVNGTKYYSSWSKSKSVTTKK